MVGKYVEKDLRLLHGTLFFLSKAKGLTVWMMVLPDNRQSRDVLSLCPVYDHAFVIEPTTS